MFPSDVSNELGSETDLDHGAYGAVSGKSRVHRARMIFGPERSDDSRSVKDPALPRQIVARRGNPFGLQMPERNQAGSADTRFKLRHR